MTLPVDSIQSNMKKVYQHQGMDKENVAHLHIRILLSGKKKNLEFCMSMDGTRKHHPEWGNSDPKRWIKYVLTHKWIVALNKG